MKPLIVKPVPVPSTGHPNVPHPSLMNHEFTCGLIAPKGAGKTTVICNLLKFYKGFFHTILVFSPTIDSDEKWDWIKNQTLLVENKPLKQWVRRLGEKREVDSIVEQAKPDQALEGLVNPDHGFDGKIPEEHFFDDYDDDTFRNIMDEQMKLIKLLKKHGKTKHLANRILVIFDDLVGSALFNGKRGSYFKGVNTRHRHYSASFLMVSQGYKEIPKTIRTNFTGLICFFIGNEKEVDVIYEEFQMGLKKDDWLELYEYATGGDHSFLYINFQKPKNMRLMKNFSEYLFIK